MFVMQLLHPHTHTRLHNKKTMMIIVTFCFVRWWSYINFIEIDLALTDESTKTILQHIFIFLNGDNKNGRLLHESV